MTVNDNDKPKTPPEADKKLQDDDGGQQALDAIKNAFKPSQFRKWLS